MNQKIYSQTNRVERDLGVMFLKVLETMIFFLGLVLL